MVRPLNVACSTLCVAVLALAVDANVEARRRPKKVKENRKNKPVKRIRDDTINAGEAANLRKGPGDNYKSTGVLPPGTAVVVIALKGRWAQVRSGKNVAWLLRRSLTGYQPDSVDKAPVEGGRVWGGEMASAAFRVQVVSSDASLFVEPSSKSATAGSASRGTNYVVLSRSDDREWLEIRSKDGSVAWIQSDRVQSNTMAGVDGDGWQRAPDAPEASSWDRGSLPSLEAMMRIGIGYRAISMDFQSAGEGALANTITESQAMAAVGAVDVVWRSSSRRLHVGLDGRTRASYAKPGIDVIREDMSLGDVDFSMYETQAGLRLGIVLGDLEISPRVGGRYDAFLTRQVDNVGLLPRESLAALVGGLRIDWYRLAPEVVLSIRGDVVVSGRHKQTQGLKDGESTDIRGATGDLRAIYSASRLIDVVATFHYGWTKYVWSGRSERNPDVMRSERSDHAQSLGLGVAHRF